MPQRRRAPASNVRECTTARFAENGILADLASTLRAHSRYGQKRRAVLLPRSQNCGAAGKPGLNLPAFRHRLSFSSVARSPLTSPFWSISAVARQWPSVGSTLPEILANQKRRARRENLWID